MGGTGSGQPVGELREGPLLFLTGMCRCYSAAATVDGDVHNDGDDDALLLMVN